MIKIYFTSIDGNQNLLGSLTLNNKNKITDWISTKI